MTTSNMQSDYVQKKSIAFVLSLLQQNSTSITNTLGLIWSYTCTQETVSEIQSRKNLVDYIENVLDIANTCPYTRYFLVLCLTICNIHIQYFASKRSLKETQEQILKNRWLFYFSRNQWREETGTSFNTVHANARKIVFHLYNQMMGIPVECNRETHWARDPRDLHWLWQSLKREFDLRTQEPTHFPFWWLDLWWVIPKRHSHSLATA
jgi:hypothetical protein